MHQNSIWYDARTALDLAGRQLALAPRDMSGLLICAGLIAVAVLLGWPLRLWLVERADRAVRRVDPRGRCRAEVKAIITILGTTLLVGVAARLVRLALDAGFTLLPETASLADAAAAAIAITGLGIGIGRALSPPAHPEQRPLPFPQEMGAAIRFYSVAGAAMLGLAAFVDRASVVLQASPLSRGLAQGAVVLLEAALTAGFLIAIGRFREAGDSAQTKTETAGSTLTAVAWAAVILGLLGLLFGYGHFSAMLFQELIWASLVGLTALLLCRLIHAMIGWLLGSEHAAGHFATHIMGLRRSRIDQARILATAIASIAVWGLAALLIAAPLGGSGASVVDQLRPALLFGALRNLHVAPKAVLFAIALLIVGIALTRRMRRWLQDQFLPATSLDVGVRSSIATGTSYVGILLALIAAANVLGVALDKVTLIASALSVGIGFGLQSIIQNFVSGVILLVERPIKVGDWVSTSGAEGSVRRINVRATELVTIDGGLAIVPNSAFISANVLNRGGSPNADRLEISIKVSGSSSPREAADALLKILTDRPEIRNEPVPNVLLTTVDDPNYGFTIHAWADGSHRVAEARSELLYALAEKLQAGGMKAVIG